MGEYSSPFEITPPFFRTFWPSILVKGIEKPIDFLFEDDLGWKVTKKEPIFYAGPVLNMTEIQLKHTESGTPRIVININNVDKVLNLLQRLGIEIQKGKIYGSSTEVLQPEDFD